MSPGVTHLAVEEQTFGLIGSYPMGYTGSNPLVLVDWGISGTLPAKVAALRASIQAWGSIVVSAIAGGKPADHSEHAC